MEELKDTSPYKIIVHTQMLCLRLLSRTLQCLHGLVGYSMGYPMGHLGPGTLGPYTTYTAGTSWDVLRCTKMS